MRKRLGIVMLCMGVFSLSACGKEMVTNDNETVTNDNELITELELTKENIEELESATGLEDNHEKAQEAVENMLIGWNLGNSFDSTGDWILTYTEGTPEDFETAWNNPVTPETLMPKLKDLGFNTVRIPITWNHHFDEDGNIDSEWMNRIKEVVDWAIESDLYCIINVHHDTGSDGWLRASNSNYQENEALYEYLWKQIAEEFIDYPDTLIFEGFNEMLDENNEWNNPGQEALSVINKYNQLFVDTVRKTGGNNATRNLICNTYAAAISNTALSGFVLPEDNVEGHLIAEVHFYTPYEFITDEGVKWTTPISEYTDYVDQSVDQAFNNIERYLTAKEIPVIIGEFATDDKNNTEDRIKWYTKVISKAKEQNITCIIWDNGNGFNMGHIDRVGDQDSFLDIILSCIEAAQNSIVD